MDVDTIEPGVDFVEAIQEVVGACDVLIAVIGNRWLTLSDREGRLRLDIPEDIVRLEIATALKRGIRVVPVLVEGARMPEVGELPDDLKALVRRNAVEIGHNRFNADSEHLVTALERALGKATEQRERKENERLGAQQRERLDREQRERATAEIRERQENEQLDARRREHEEQERLEHEPQSQPPSPVAPVASAKTTKVVYPLQPKPAKPEPEKLPPSSSGGTGGKGPSKQVIVFLAIAAVLVVGGLIYLAIKLSQPPPSQSTTASPSPSLSVIAQSTPVTPPLREEVTSKTLDKASKEQPWVNSLGMKFVPVAGMQVLFSIWDTRVEDFRAFVESAGFDATGGMWSLGKDGWKQRGATWKEPGFQQGSTDPVVGVSWDDAKAFCEWLAKRERGSGTLSEGMHYRLPTDKEWSLALGLDSEPGNTPQEKNSQIKLYLWGKGWPPPSGAGNYCGVESRTGNEPQEWFVIEGYNDRYPRTSPVGSFAANTNGLYDMGGNVWQPCEDRLEKGERVLRGASWADYFPDYLHAFSQGSYMTAYRNDFFGFRCVVERESSR